MKKFFILLMVVIMLAGLAFSSLAKQTGYQNANLQDGEPTRDCLKDGSCIDCPNPDGCVPEGDEHKGDRWEQ